MTPDKALVIRDDKGKFRDMGDVLSIARAEGKKLFRTHENVSVVRLMFDVEVGWVAVVRFPVETWCSKSPVVGEGEKQTVESKRNCETASSVA